MAEHLRQQRNRNRLYNGRRSTYHDRRRGNWSGGFDYRLERQSDVVHRNDSGQRLQCRRLCLSDPGWGHRQCLPGDGSQRNRRFYDDCQRGAGDGRLPDRFAGVAESGERMRDRDGSLSIEHRSLRVERSTGSDRWRYHYRLADQLGQHDRSDSRRRRHRLQPDQHQRDDRDSDDRC